MVCSSLRCLAGGALTLAILPGCTSRSPFSDPLDAERSRHPQTLRADASTAPPDRGDASEQLPLLNADAQLEDYLRYAALENPGLEAMFQEWKATVERLPQVGALPDPRFTYGYYLGEVETRVGPMQHSLALSQIFPWFDAGVREAIARRLAAAGRRGDAANRLASELQEALFEHADARRRVALYRDTLIPKATESLQASLGSFEQGQADFLDLIDTQRTLIEFQLAIERALVDRATSAARLERLVGVPLSELDDTAKLEGTTP